MKKELSIELTNNCQLECFWCSLSDLNTGLFLELDKIISILKTSRKEGFNHVRFTGGEPTLHPDINECINIADHLGYHVTLLTNGITNYFNENIDTYEIQWRNNVSGWIRLLKIQGYNVIINVVNIKESDIINALKFAMDNDIQIHIMKLQMSGKAIINKNNLHPIDITTTGCNGCNRDNKRLYTVHNELLYCTADKSKEKCKYK